MTKDNNVFKTTELFWGCECEHNYIHETAKETVCSVCGAIRDDMPDSRINEVWAHWLRVLYLQVRAVAPDDKTVRIETISRDWNDQTDPILVNVEISGEKQAVTLYFSGDHNFKS